MVDLLRIETFLHAADNLNFSETARILHLAQPTVSHHIKTLEKELGVELFERQGAALKLTEAGRLLIPWAKKVLRDSDTINISEDTRLKILLFLFPVHHELNSVGYQI